MAENDLAERVREYASFLDRSREKLQGDIMDLSQRNPNTRGRIEDALHLTGLRGQDLAYQIAVGELKEKFPELYESKAKTE